MPASPGREGAADLEPLARSLEDILEVVLDRGVMGEASDFVHRTPCLTRDPG